MTAPLSTENKGLTEWLEEAENDVNHMLWPSQSLLPVYSDLSLTEHLCDILN